MKISDDCGMDYEFMNLPDDAKIAILKYCDIQTLGRLSCTSKSMKKILSQDCVWSDKGKTSLFTNQISKVFLERSSMKIREKDKCRIAQNWIQGYCRKYRAFGTSRRFMPWMQLDKDCLWYSKGGSIYCLPRHRDGCLTYPSCKILKHNFKEVVRFQSTSNYIVAGFREKQICAWRKSDAKIVFSVTEHTPSAHEHDVNSVSCSGNMIVSGSRDKSVKMWSIEPNTQCKYTLYIGDNIWDVSFLPTKSSFICGSARLNNIPPLHLCDAEKGTKVVAFGTNSRRGAGVLHICPESAHEFLACSYDSTIQLWDTRTPTKCVRMWDDPNNCVIYCLDSDHHISFVSGASHHGIVCLWDKRASSCLRLYYLAGYNSPVYSIAFDPYCLYGALDRSLHVLNFSKS